MNFLETSQNTEFEEKVKFYRTGGEVMFWVLFIMFIWVIGGDII